ncbi:DUF421 domain-containing protein [Neolewinella antarctica]|uniref:Uncharacterized membrane protein YcaP (DUF421 family) n=1 Tax=Neolewinella antarctica TaxID=442734 RepID=A0ABX0XBR9_9BACT|nr:YetF domain-containing protein [Neolewinella antarctica]NJC26389.1 uncharacterized membrane protein YcaP (DUF421 family) [Neolewinella antarctica]
MYEFLQPDWVSISQILITAPLLYLVVIIGIRTVGNRSTSAMNNFDWIVTVAIGGIFASTVIIDSANLLDGVIGICLLLGLQYCLTLLVRKSKMARGWLKATPQLLVYEGKFLEDNMDAERIVREEVYAAIRDKGYKSIDDIYAVVLETNARLSIIPNKDDDQKGFSLADVGGLPDGLTKDLEDRGDGDDTDEEDRKAEMTSASLVTA